MCYNQHMTYTEEYKIIVLNWAKEHGTIGAARHFDLQSSTIIRWNKKYRIYEIRPMRKFSEKQRIEILNFAEERGLTNAMRFYNVDVATIQEWNETRKIYTGKKTEPQEKKKYIEKSESEILEILNFAKTRGPVAAARKYNVPDSTIRNWNAKYKVYETRKKRNYSDETKSRIVCFALQKTVAEAAKEFNLSNHQIRKWINAAKEKGR